MDVKRTEICRITANFLPQYECKFNMKLKKNSITSPNTQQKKQHYFIKY